MARKIKLFTNGTFHIYNRGTDRRRIFQTPNDYQRFLDTIKYYRFQQNSKLSTMLDEQINSPQLTKLKINPEPIVQIINYCLMPNHFHFTLKQTVPEGTQIFMQKLGTSYTKFFNIKYERDGVLFQGTFKAVLVENEEQLIHLSRYIHLNPVTASLVKINDLPSYGWSSYPDYLGLTKESFVQKEVIIGAFQNSNSYRNFVEATLDETEVEKVKGLTIDNELPFDLLNQPYPS